MRSTIYADLYGTTYRYAATSSTSSTGLENLDDPLGDDMPVPIDPMKKSFEAATKPYIQPTAMNETAVRPFGSVLDAPLG